MDLKLLVECFRLEQRVAVAGADFKDEIANTIPFQNFKSHSQAGLEILRKKVSDESNLGYLKS
ncbi:CIC11C00000001759 [Sungouiella intermedia]|uniref:CIC11C00000001759 n=1 Tax=Sungouiella intermedia TaxID=45354 RepID=A0A1L0D4Y8_9ASCO|nr:CIC11C00000001759 [[Candida] intermedia]